MMKYTAEQRARLMQDAKGRTIDHLEWVEGERYWVMVFKDSSEMCFRFMAELV